MIVAEMIVLLGEEGAHRAEDLTFLDLGLLQLQSSVRLFHESNPLSSPAA